MRIAIKAFTWNTSSHICIHIHDLIEIQLTMYTCISESNCVYSFMEYRKWRRLTLEYFYIVRVIQQCSQQAK